MSYDISLVNRETKEPVKFKNKHNITGGTYPVGGTTEASLNVTYNYGGHFRRVMGENGIRTLYGLTPAESLPVIINAIKALKSDASSNYWEATEGNAQLALINLNTLAVKAIGENIDCIWDGD